MPFWIIWYIYALLSLKIGLDDTWGDIFIEEPQYQGPVRSSSCHGTLFICDPVISFQIQLAMLSLVDEVDYIRAESATPGHLLKLALLAVMRTPLLASLPPTGEGFSHQY